MEKQYAENCLLNSAVLAIDSGKKVFETTAIFQAKADGAISAPKATGDCPTLVGVKNPDGVVCGDLAAKGVRTYTLIGTISRTTSAVSLSWIASFDTTVFELGYTKNINTKLTDRNQFIIGYCTILNGAVTAWVPGTTDIDAASVESFIINQFGFVGA